MTHHPSREIYVKRTLNTSRDHVLNLWSDPRALTNWWGPEGFSTTTHNINFQPGGHWDFTMHGPDGIDYPNYIQYTETGPDRITYFHGESADDSNRFDVEITLTTLEPNKTDMEFRCIFTSAEERDRMATEYGAEEGLAQTMDRMVRLVNSE